jgi:hypothetical protein
LALNGSEIAAIFRVPELGLRYVSDPDYGVVYLQAVMRGLRILCEARRGEVGCMKVAEDTRHLFGGASVEMPDESPLLA